VIKVGTIRKRASVIFYLVDDFFGKAVKTANISVSGQDLPFVNKQDGYYVFPNLPQGNYTFTIQAPNYLSTERSCPVSEDQPAIIQINMQHDTSSRLIDDITRIKGTLTDKNGNLLKNEIIEVVVISPATYVRLVEDVSKGQDKVKLYSEKGYQLEGKLFFISGEKNSESIRICKYDQENDFCLIENKLKNKYNSGTQLYAMWELKTDNSGEFILPLPISFNNGAIASEIKVLQGKKAGHENVDLVAGKISNVKILL